MKRKLQFPESDLFTQEELQAFWDQLVAERDKLLDHAREAVKKGAIKLDTNEMMDEVDLASATIEQNLFFRLLDRERKLLSAIDRAMGKLRNGDFGYCEGTGDPIPKKRLELTPWTRHSVKYKEYIERMNKRGRSISDEENVS